ncbi:MAG: hypothetical protein HXX14_01185 [Bacteroidetes bacterium]|nr:hypothetical protein [Bacteroidota bacterium]
MNADKIKQDIKNRISIIDKSFGTYSWINVYKDKLLGVEILPLERTLRSANLRFKINVGWVFVLTALLSFLAIRVVQDRDVLDFKKMSGVVVLMSLVFGVILNTFKLYKLKTNLEIKIYLIKLRNMIDGN